MRKNITKEQILEKTLELMKDKNDIQSINLREIARCVGCAHTNLYNYFTSLDDLLWEAHSLTQKKFIEILLKTLSTHETSSNSTTLSNTYYKEIYNAKLECFFNTFLEFYLYNTGWFCLSWMHHIKGNRPEKNKSTHKETIDILIDTLINIWNKIYNTTPRKEDAYAILHNTHCYIIGEVSNYINNRAIIEDINMLKKYILKESITIFTLGLQERIKNKI
ncbi:TetR/AcrR family transcriptional regulator [Clostridioides difficile]